MVNPALLSRNRKPLRTGTTPDALAVAGMVSWSTAVRLGGRSLLQETTKKGWFSLGLRIESLKESYLKEIDQQVGNTYFI